MPGDQTRSTPHRPTSHDLPSHRPIDQPDTRPSIGVYFRCANAYCRVFRNAQGTAYLARCPKCAKTKTFRVGQGGSPQRQFVISC